MKDFVLFILSLIYRMFMSWRGMFYTYCTFASYKLPGATVSVGNLAFGGTGKSPFVIALCQEFKKQGRHVIVLTRGYKSGLKSNEFALLLGGEVTYSKTKSKLPFYADEAMMQSNELPSVPIIVGANRRQALLECMPILSKLTQIDSQQWVFILDDGYQHMQIHRDLNICLIDYKSFGMRRALYRESFSALKRADVVALTRCGKIKVDFEALEILRKFTKNGVQIITSWFETGMPVNNKGFVAERNKKYLLLCAIAFPERLFSELVALGYMQVETCFFSDHERFALEKISLSLDDFSGVITTKKDYWRDPNFFNALGLDVFTVPMTVHFHKENALTSLVHSLNGVLQ